MLRPALAAMMLALSLATVAPAQDSQTLADIRQELTVLSSEIEGLRRELSTTSAPRVPAGGDSVLDRVAAIEAELQRLTALTERLDFRIQQIVRDGTNRIGDLEFRLLELEGGDIAALGETPELGGSDGTDAPAAIVPPAAPISPPPVTDDPGAELAVGERADFDAAQAALDAGNAQAAADGFAAFEAAYPGSPLMAEAMYGRGQALRALGDAKAAARAYLDSFSTDNQSAVAPDALVGLGAMLGALGSTQQACVTLAEVAARYPGSPAVERARSEQALLGCL